MGEAKRRAAQGLPPREKKAPEKTTTAKKAPGKRSTPASPSPRLVNWLPLTREQADQFVSWTTRGAWVGIAALVLFWVTVRFIGPAFGWWALSDG